MRAKALASSNDNIRAEAIAFETRVSAQLNSIAAKLARKTYKFPKATGVLKDKKKREAVGKDPRPIVVASIESRVVQRALLQVLQPSDAGQTSLGKIADVNACPHSYGCVPNGSVKRAVRRASEIINAGNSYFYKTDISGFFNKIPHRIVIDFVRQETGDPDIAEILSNALNVELENKDEIDKYYDLFPHDGIGVPQGSSLSAFCGNVLLYDFDLSINSQPDVFMLRYVDDVIVLSNRNENVQKAKGQIITELRGFGLSPYDPARFPEKAAEGHARVGIDYLGCSIQGNAISPATQSCKKLLLKVQTELKNSKPRILEFLNSPSPKHRMAEAGYVGTLAKIDRMIYGWSHSFSFVNDRLAFSRIDTSVNKMLEDYRTWFERVTKSSDWQRFRRASGIALCTDIPPSTE